MGGVVKHSYEFDEVIRKGRSDGLSYGQIAQILGVGKNVVIGRGRRIGLSSPLTAGGNNLCRKALQTVDLNKPLPPRNGFNLIPDLKNALRDGDEDTIIPRKSNVVVTTAVKPARYRDGDGDLVIDDCSFPIGTPSCGSFQYCGAAAVRGKPYCAEHVAISYILRQPRRISMLSTLE